MKYKFNSDKLSRYITVIFIVVVLALLAFIYYTSGGSYFPAWLTTLVVSIALLGALSIPKYAVVTPISVEIHCVMELTRIQLHEISRVKVLENRQMNWCVPFFGVFGVFGYYGYYIDLKEFRTFKIYARHWDNFVLIEDIYDNRFIISVDQPLEFIKEIENLR